MVIPLFGDRFELSASAIGALVAVGTAADFVLFPVAGFIMDRFGRLYSMVPAFGLMALGLLLLAVAGSTSEVVVAGIVIGVGNGLSSGSMLTMSTDLAPSDAYGPFIAGFSMAAGVGRLVGPTVVGMGGRVDRPGRFGYRTCDHLGFGALMDRVRDRRDRQTLRQKAQAEGFSSVLRRTVGSGVYGIIVCSSTGQA